MTQKERFLATVGFKKPDFPFVRFMPGWNETMKRWKNEGWNGRSLDKIFSTDAILNLGYYIKGATFHHIYGPVPPFSRETVKENEHIRLVINEEGILMKEFKNYTDSSMPQFLKFPVRTRKDFRKFQQERLQPNFSQRLPLDWRKKLSIWPNGKYPVMCYADRWGGFYGPLRNLMGVMDLSMTFYDDPAFIEEMMAERAESIISITDEILKYTSIDAFMFWEDMGFNKGSLINPMMYRKMALKHYRRVCDWIRSKGINYIFLDSDGNIWELIPLWIEAGINGVFPCDVNAGMDVVKMRQEYGKDLVLMGGIDKRAVAKGGKIMREEVDRVIPIVEKGGYIPHLDHGAPPDISWQNMSKYMNYLMGRLGRGCLRKL